MADWIQWYQLEKPLYEKFTVKIHSLLDDLLKNEDIKAVIESRAKEIDKFAEKISRPGKCYKNPPSEITDLAGIRVILRTTDDVERVSKIISDEFTIDDKNSVNKIDQLDPDQFGYLSRHYIVKIKDPRSVLLEWKRFDKLWAEIQVRTILQHAWATVEHSMDYKSEYDIPKQLRRRLFRLSALFELADQELNNIVIDGLDIFEQYKKQVVAHEPNIELNLDSLKAYLQTSDIVAYWTNFIESLGVKIFPIGIISRDVKMALMADIGSINEINQVLEDSKGWGEEYLKEFYHNSFGTPVPNGCASDMNGIITIFLIGNFPEIFTDQTLNNELGFGRPERATIPAKKYKPKSSRA